MAKDSDKLKLGKGAAFQKAALKRLPQQDETWEADFQMMPKPMGQNETHYLGLVVVRPGSDQLAERPIEGRPSVNDLATLLADAMRRPATGKPRRPERVLVRGRHQWRELFPHLAELDIEVSVERELPAILATYQQHLRRQRDARAAGATKPSAAQLAVEQLFPAITLWVNGYGHVEVGDQEGFGFIVRALDYGGLVFEDDYGLAAVGGSVMLRATEGDGGRPMTEAEWLACAEPAKMLHTLVYIPRPDKCIVPGVGGLWFTERKLYLLTLACVRAEIVGRPNGTDALEAFERAADAEHPRSALLEECERFPGYCRFDWPDYNLAKSTVHMIGQHGCSLIRDIFGNPFRPLTISPSWRTDTPALLARTMYDARDFGVMPILADALQDAGCDSTAILDHCRDANQIHVRGCWVVDLVLGKE